jgi:hypothetical protein
MLIPKGRSARIVKRLIQVTDWIYGVIKVSPPARSLEGGSQIMSVPGLVKGHTVYIPYSKEGRKGRKFRKKGA